MRSMILAAALGAAVFLGSQAALAFTFENQGTTQPSAQEPTAKAGYVDVNPGSLMPPMGEPIKSFDFGPGSSNNGMAAQPTRRDSVGPSWLYPPN